MKFSHNNKEGLDFGGARIGQLFRKIFFPTLIGMIFNSVLTLIDGIFVGQGVGADGIAAVNIVAPVIMIVIGIGLMLGIGASVVASIRLADNDVHKASTAMTQAFLVGTLIVLLFIVPALFYPVEIAYGLGSSTSLEHNAVSYLLPLAPGLLFLLLQCVGMMLVRLDGSPQYAMWCQAIPATVNIVLDYIMIFPMGMGVAGAALATSISCGLGGIMILSYFVFMSDKLRFIRLRCSIDAILTGFKDVINMAKIGLATFISELAFGFMMFIGNAAFMKIDGEPGVAAYSVACYLFPVVFSMANAVAQSAQPIISFNYGNGSRQRVNATLKIAVFTSIICGFLVLIGLYATDNYVVGAFINPSERAFDLAAYGLPLFATSAVFFAVNITFIGYYQSIERAWISIFYTLLRGVVFLYLAFILLPSSIGESGLWLAIPASEFLTMLIILTAFFSRKHI